jgi:LysR family carnitine catabolism transcriptional activator
MSEPWHRSLALENGTLDFAIGALDSTVPTSWEIFPLLEDPFAVVAHKDDPLAKFHHLPLKQLSARHMIIFSTGNMNRLVNTMIESHRLNLKIGHRVDFLETFIGACQIEISLGNFTKTLYRNPE